MCGWVGVDHPGRFIAPVAIILMSLPPQPGDASPPGAAPPEESTPSTGDEPAPPAPNSATSLFDSQLKRLMVKKATFLKVPRSFSRIYDISRGKFPPR